MGRRRGTRYIRSRLLRVALGGALLIWMGAMVVAFLNYQAPAEPELSDGATDSPPAPQRSDQERRMDQRLSSQRISRRPSAASPQKNARARVDRGVTAQAATDPQDQSKARAQRQPQAADEPVQGSADLAQLETGSEAGVEPDTAPNRVMRAQFTTEIVEREPVNRIEAVFSINGEVYSTDGRALQALYYFSEVEGMRGETLTHRWEHEGEVVAETSFTVRDDPWRVYSRHDLAPAMGGDWRVVVTDAAGKVIATDEFSYQSY